MIHALLIPLLLAAPPAAKAPPAPDAANVAKAKESFSAGQKLYKAGKYADAIARFEEAYAARPHPVIFFNIGKCWEQLGENAKALRAFRDYLRLAPDAKDKDTVVDAMANLERRLREKGLQQLLVYAEPATARIVVDGKDIGTSPASVELVAGSHKLEVSAPGFEKYERQFNFAITRASEMSVTLEPPKSTVASDAPKAEPKSTEPSSKLDPGPPPPAPPMVSTEPAKKGRVWAYVVGGVAVASAGAGLGLGLAANGEAEKFVNVANPHDPATVNRDYQSVQGLATGANVAYGVAGAAAITAVILFILEK